VLIGADVVKRNKLHKFAVVPKWWVVECTLGGWKNSAVIEKIANAKFITYELVPKLIDYALKRMVLEQALGKTGQISLKSGPVFPLIQGSCSKN
jgi:hypothetical protein